MQSLTRASTGMRGLDKALDSLRLGDNVVWQVDAIADYQRFAIPFVNNALNEGRNLIYFRFAKHPSVIEFTGEAIDNAKNIKLCILDASMGFESFSAQVNEIVAREGREAYYVFDCLSDLLPLWASDLMIGNFFVITCPYLFELDTIAYFALLRNSHSFSTIARIRETTQLLIDIYNNAGNYYVHPLKVWQRYSPTMFLPHYLNSDDLKPVTSSVDVTGLFAAMDKMNVVAGMNLENEKRNLDYWDRLFLEAAEQYRKILQSEPYNEHESHNYMFDHLYRLMIGRDERILSLAEKTLSIKDLLEIKSRMIGSGFIGGKAAGMLIARSILLKDASFDWKNQLEQHDSFYIGSDVFYSYIVQNGWWKLRLKQRTTEGFFEAAPVLREKMLSGSFPEEIRERFRQMLEYYGQSPIIVRSSSLLEDAFGNAFAGKYESIFCANKGSPAERYRQFEDAVRRVYASAMNEDALIYRIKRGLAYKDEQMAILVQRVSGDYHGSYFFPDMAGVGVSYNTYVWNSDMDPKSGMLRLVYGLGTRAVDRVDGDYPRLIALDFPRLRPHAGLEDIRKYSQHEVDLLNIPENSIQTVELGTLAYPGQEKIMNMIAINDFETLKQMKVLGINAEKAWLLTFDRLVAETHFILLMQKMLKTLESFYDYPVDMEFTANLDEQNNVKINLLQCRPLQAKGLGKNIIIPPDIPLENIVLESKGNFMGGNISQSIDRFIYIIPEKYSELTLTERYEVARVVGILNKSKGFDFDDVQADCDDEAGKNATVVKNASSYNNSEANSNLGTNSNSIADSNSIENSNFYVNSVPNSNSNSGANTVSGISTHAQINPDTDNINISSKQFANVLLAGPGRWGTSTPSLGVPVKFSEINNVNVLMEVSFSSAGLIPELSFGTHFFQDLVETGIFYVAVFREKDEVTFNTAWMKDFPNKLASIIPKKSHMEDVIKVIDIIEKKLILKADVVTQRVMLFFEDAQV